MSNQHVGLSKRVIIRDLPESEQPPKPTSSLVGTPQQHIRLVEVVNWGTDEHFNPFTPPLNGNKAFVRADTTGFMLPDGTSVVERGALLALKLD